MGGGRPAEHRDRTFDLWRWAARSDAPRRRQLGEDEPAQFVRGKSIGLLAPLAADE